MKFMVKDRVKFYKLMQNSTQNNPQLPKRPKIQT